jgi:branched-chain amino acid transport system permease protein
LVGALLAILTLKMRDFVLKLTTIAFGEALSVLAFNWDYIGGANSFTGIAANTTMTTCVVGTLVALYVTWRFDGSRLGFAARAIRDDPVAATAMGVSLAHLRTLTFALGAALIGIAGAIQANYVLIVSPHDLGFFVSLNFIIFLLFGGMQTMWGPVLGAILLTALPEALRFAKEYRLIVYGLIIVIVILKRPQGLLSRTPTGLEKKLFGFIFSPERAAQAPYARADNDRGVIVGVVNGILNIVPFGVLAAALRGHIDRARLVYVHRREGRCLRGLRGWNAEHSNE